MISMIPAMHRYAPTAEHPSFGLAHRGAAAPVRSESARLTTFELADRLVQAWSRNERRLETLDAIDEGIASARRHLATPGARHDLARARLALLQARREACSTEARADRRIAEALVSEWQSRHQFDSRVG